MADQKITDLAAQDPTVVADDDQLAIVDVSDGTMAASGTNKKVSAAALARAVDVMSYGAEGGGTADDTGALTAALAAHDVVRVPPGFTCKVGDVIVDDDKTILGGGTIKKASGSTSALHLVGANPTIRDLVFQGETTSGQPNSDIKLGDGSSNILIDNNRFRTSTYSAIAAATDTDVGGSAYSVPVSGVQITNNRFTSAGTNLWYARPLFLHSVENMIISLNLFRDCQFDAIRLRNNDGYCVIDTNLFVNIGDPTWPDEQTRDAIDTFWGGQKLTITNNIVRTTAYHGFDIKGADPTGTLLADRVVIAKNQLYNCRRSGIVLTGPHDYDGAGNYKFLAGINIEGNILEGNNQNMTGGSGDVGDAAIRLKQLVAHCKVTNNDVIANLGRGIYAHNQEAGKASSYNIKIRDNDVINNGHTGNTEGILVNQGVGWIDITGNTVMDDTNVANSGKQTHGILYNQTGNGYTAPDRSVRIDGNTVRGNTTSQIRTDPNNARANAIASFSGNVQEGTGAHERSWHHRRKLMFGTAAPLAADGSFEAGDVVFDTTPTANAGAGWICTVAGAPGTWVEFGRIGPEKAGATASVADGGTITHGLGTTPTVVVAVPSVANEFVSVTALGAATFTVAIKKDDGTAGTSQTIYWRASA